MPKLAAVLESLDGIAEPLREFYTEVDGKYVLDADIESHPSTEGLRNTAKQRRAERERVEKELKVFKDLGFTPEQIAELRDAAKEAQKGETGDKPDLDKLRTKWRDEFNKEVAPKLTELEQMRTENRKLKLHDKLAAAFQAEGGRTEDVDLMLKDLVDIADLNEKGEPVLKDAEGDPMAVTLKEFFGKAYKERRANLYNGNTAAGGGARQSNAGGSGDQTIRSLPGSRMIESAFTGKA